MYRYAIVVDTVVENVVVWDGVTICADITSDAIRLPDGSPVSSGYSYDNGTFTPPEPPPRGGVA